MSAPAKVPAHAPFRVLSFRFQWPADLVTSWAFEMESVILGWYVLVETESVLLLTLFASLQYIGTLISPLIGMMGDRFGHRNVLCAMRALYTMLATTLMTLVFAGVLTPLHVFVIAALMGLVRSSDIVMRNALIGETMPPDTLIGAVSLSRATSDSARIAGALAGAGTVATLGMGPAYLVIASFYLTSFLLTRRVGGVRSGHRTTANTARAARPSPWRDLKDAAAHVWSAPHLLAAMILAFLLNLTAFPLISGLLPYVVKQIYRSDQTVLGYLVASFAFGAILGSIVVSRFGSIIRPGRMIVVFAAMWYVTLIAFAQQQSPISGILMLMLSGCTQTLCLVPLSTMLLRTSDEKFRGRVMGIRSLAVYGLPIGLWISGPLIARFGYQTTATVYCLLGLALTLVIAVRWRTHLWRLAAPANTR